MLQGLRVVMLEMEIYCRSNPLRLANGTADVLVLEHNTSDEVNVGFWIAYLSCTMIDVYRRIYTWAMKKRTLPTSKTSSFRLLIPFFTLAPQACASPLQHGTEVLFRVKTIRFCKAKISRGSAPMPRERGGGHSHPSSTSPPTSQPQTLHPKTLEP